MGNLRHKKPSHPLSLESGAGPELDVDVTDLTDLLDLSSRTG